MDLNELKETDIWTLYDNSVSYCRLIGMYTDSDVNYRMYNGDQWYGLKIIGVDKFQYNFIKPIVKYKTGIVLCNLFAINYSSENFENKEFRKTATEICELLNKKVARIWEKDKMDIKLRLIVKDAAINDEGVIYVSFSNETGLPVNEILNKNDIYYGNENDSDIQSQPYILIKQRKPVIEVQQIAELSGVPAEKIQGIMGDMDNIEEAGDSAKYEKDNMCTLVTKLYKEHGTVHFEQATRYVEIKKDTNTGLTYYPVAHLLWEEKKGSARGEGEVRHLIPNQLETNKTAMRRAVAVHNNSYPQKVVSIDKIQNKNDLSKIGGVIKVSGANVDDVTKLFAHIPPAQMSPDAEKLQQELIASTRELAGAGEIATGEINPESASGRAILAVQQASQQPLTEHLEYTKAFIEDVARIWLDMMTVYNDSVQLEKDITDHETGEETTIVTEVLQDTLKELQASVKVDITPKGPYDRYAQEQTLENLLKGGYFSPQKISETKAWAKALPDDSVAPKAKILEIIDLVEEEQRKIAMLEADARRAQQVAQQFLSGDIEQQSQQMADVMKALQMQNGVENQELIPQ